MTILCARGDTEIWVKSQGVCYWAAAAVAVVGAGAAYYGMQNLRKRPALAPFGFDLSEDERARGAAFLKAHPAIDAHAHPGQTFVKGASGLPPLLKLYSAKGTFEARTISDMIEGRASGLQLCRCVWISM